MKHTGTISGSRAAAELTGDLVDLIHQMQTSNEPFVLATVVRTISVTAAKAGAKAVISSEGEIVGGWIGGGCAKSAVIKAARTAFADGEARLISIQPADLLSELGVEPGEEREGVQFAKNMCPSQGTMDIFIEPVLPRPQLAIFGASPVALALAIQGPTIGFDVTICGPLEDFEGFPGEMRRNDGFNVNTSNSADTYIVVSTQGRGDLAALDAAIKTNARHVGFVGSRRKIDTLKSKLKDQGINSDALERIKGPAGLDLGAITPEEIALSILAELLMVRRKNQRLSRIQHV